MPVMSRPSRVCSMTPLHAASVVTPSKHSPGPSPYIGWKWSKPHTPSKPSCSANCARETTSLHGMRCCAMSSPNCIRPCYHARNPRGSTAGSDRRLRHHAAQVVRRERTDDRVDRGACRRGAVQAEQRRELAEVVAGAGPLQEVLAPARLLAHEVDLARLDDVRDVAFVTLREQ